MLIRQMRTVIGCRYMYLFQKPEESSVQTKHNFQA